ncbi:MAG: tetratricopeptide repeat protein [Planctomycetota bacterium]
MQTPKAVIGVLVLSALLIGGVAYFVVGSGRTSDVAPEPQVAPAATAEALLEAARAAVRSDEPEKGVAVLRSAVGQFPEDPDLRLALAEVLVRTGDYQGATDQFAFVISAGGADAQTLYAAGSVARNAGQPERAVAWLAEASQRAPADPAIALHLGQARLALGETASAKADLLRAATLDEGLAIAWGTLGEIALRENNSGIARDMARRARGLEPTVAAWRVIEARALNRLGAPADALQVLAGVGPDAKASDGVLKTQGESFGLLGRPEEAAALYESVGRDYDAALWFERAGLMGEALAAARRAAEAGDHRANALVERRGP